MDDKDYVRELMTQVRQIADGQIRIEGKLDVMSGDYNGKINAQCIRIDTLETKLEDMEEQRKWLERTIVGQVIVTFFGLIAFFFKQ